MPTNIPIKNTNQMNQLKISVENAEIDPKTKKKEWKPGSVTYLKPGESFDVYSAETRRISIVEMPT